MLISGIGKVRPFGRSPRRLRTYAPESLTLFAAMTPAPNTSQKNAIDTFMRNGFLPIWPKEDGIYIHHSYASQPALLNWKNPSESASPINSPVFTALSGYQGDMVSANLTYPTALSAYALNNCHLASAQAISLAGAALNPRVGDSRVGISNRRTAYFPRNTTDQTPVFCNSGVGGNVSPYIPDTQLTILNRTNSANFDVYSNGSLITNVVSASANVPTLPIRTLADATGVGAIFGNMRVSFLSFGANLTAGEIAALNAAWLAYLAAMV